MPYVLYVQRRKHCNLNEFPVFSSWRGEDAVVLLTLWCFEPEEGESFHQHKEAGPRVNESRSFLFKKKQTFPRWFSEEELTAGASSADPCQRFEPSPLHEVVQCDPGRAERVRHTHYELHSDWGEGEASAILSLLLVF